MLVSKKRARKKRLLFPPLRPGRPLRRKLHIASEATYTAAKKQEVAQAEVHDVEKLLAVKKVAADLNKNGGQEETKPQLIEQAVQLVAAAMQAHLAVQFQQLQAQVQQHERRDGAENAEVPPIISNGEGATEDGAGFGARFICSVSRGDGGEISSLPYKFAV